MSDLAARQSVASLVDECRGMSREVAGLLRRALGAIESSSADEKPTLEPKTADLVGVLHMTRDRLGESISLARRLLTDIEMSPVVDTGEKLSPRYPRQGTA